MQWNTKYFPWVREKSFWDSSEKKPQEKTHREKTCQINEGKFDEYPVGNTIENQSETAGLISNEGIEHKKLTGRDKVIGNPFLELVIRIFFAALMCYSIHLMKTYIHELGHVLISVLFNWEIHGISVSFNPFGGNYCLIAIPLSSLLWQRILLYSFGSIFSFIFGSIIISLGKREIIKIFYPNAYILLWGLYCIMDLPEYIFRDIMFERAGDWFYVYNYLPALVIGILFFSSLYTIWNTRKIYNYLVGKK